MARASKPSARHRKLVARAHTVLLLAYGDVLLATSRARTRQRRQRQPHHHVTRKNGRANHAVAAGIWWWCCCWRMVVLLAPHMPCGRCRLVTAPWHACVLGKGGRGWACEGGWVCSCPPPFPPSLSCRRLAALKQDGGPKGQKTAGDSGHRPRTSRMLSSAPSQTGRARTRGADEADAR